jgi:exosortase
MGLIGMGVLLSSTGFLGLINLSRNDYLSLMTFSALMIWLGLFVLFYGFGTFRKAAFPLLFLLCMVPLPTFLLNAFVLLLQKGSAETVNAIFHLLGLQMTRDGYTFHFPRLSIEIWENCTGIRASIALLITSIVASHLFLVTGWARTLLILSSIPITIVKNALRIAVLSLIGVHVDEGVFDSHLHNVAGGALFFIFALFLLWTVIMILNRVDSPLDKEKKSMGLSA